MMTSIMREKLDQIDDQSTKETREKLVF